jgi:lipid A 3-O-deacylase
VNRTTKKITIRGLKGVFTVSRYLPALILAAVFLTAGSRSAEADYQYPKQSPWWLSEIKGGVFIHDVGVFGRSEEDTSPVINGEVLFNLKGKIWDVIWSPRPHVGVSVNTGGDTSQAYTGMTWDFNMLGNGFGSWSMGAAVHDGSLTTNKLDEKELGSRVLFRFALEFGVRLTEHHNVSIILDHISNGDLKDENEGIDNFGVRYGYRF